MTSLKLSFDASGWDVDFSSSVAELDASAQVALVNIATEFGSDRSAPTAGTKLLSQGLAGLLSNRRAAVHAANWAAAETLEFVNTNSPTDEWLQGIWLELKDFVPPRIELNAVIQGASGKSVGYPMTL